METHQISETWSGMPVFRGTKIECEDTMKNPQYSTYNIHPDVPDFTIQEIPLNEGVGTIVSSEVLISHPFKTNCVIMERYLIFAGSHYCPLGGMLGYQTNRGDYSQAVVYARNLLKDNDCMFGILEKINKLHS